MRDQLKPTKTPDRNRPSPWCFGRNQWFHISCEARDIIDFAKLYIVTVSGISQFLHNDTYRVVIGEIMSMLLDCLCSCMAVLANVCLVQNTWMTTDFRCAEIAKRLLSGAVGHMIIIVVSNPNCLFSPPSMWVGLVTSCSNCSRSRYLGFKYQRMQILSINFKILMVSQARSFLISLFYFSFNCRHLLSSFSLL